MEWLEILQIIGLPTICSGIATMAVSRYYTLKDKKNKNKDDLSTKVNNMEHELGEFKKQQEVKNEMLEERIENLNQSLADLNKLLSNSSNALQALLRDSIINMYNKYSQEQYMPVYEKESLENLYRQYHNLNGNGVVEHLVEKLYNLPAKPSQDKT